MSSHAKLRKRFEDAAKSYRQDLDAMAEASLILSPGGVARPPCDFTFEVAYVNRRIAKRLRGETPPPPAEGWVTAPDEFRTKATTIEEFQSAADDLLAAWDGISDSEIDREIVLQSGSTTTPSDLMYLAAYHAGYHDAQLNYHQAIQGDGEVHWA